MIKKSGRGLIAETGDAGISSGLKLFLALSCGLIVANLYYAQPIITTIAADLGFDLTSSGLIVTVIQIGYGFGVLLFVPLGDLVQNRRLIPILVICSSAALLAAAFSRQASGFLVAVFLIGLFSSAVQLVVPFTVGLASYRQRGRTIGLVVSGVVCGIVLARPVSSLITGAVGWRAINLGAALVMAVLSPVLYLRLPGKSPSAGGLSYMTILRSMVKLFITVPKLPTRLCLTALMFMSFMMFWSTTPIVLRDIQQFNHTDIAIFSLIGLVAAPCVILAGRFVDGGHGRMVMITGICLVATAFLLTPVFGFYTELFVLAVFLLDPGVNVTNLVIQQSILSLIPEARSRLNAMCVASSFGGGAMGSALGPWIYGHYGWEVTAFGGAAMMMTALILNLFLKKKEVSFTQRSGCEQVCDSTT